MIIKQSKGLQHCKDIKRHAINVYYFTDKNTENLQTCIRLALKEHVELLQEEARILEKVRTVDAPTPVRDDGPLLIGSPSPLDVV